MLKKTLRYFGLGIAIFCSSLIFLNIFILDVSTSWSHDWYTVCEENEVIHQHPSEQYSYEEAVAENTYVLNTYTCIYDWEHLPSYRFNCHAFAYQPGIYCWVDDPDEVTETIWPDDFETVGWPYQVGDRVGYYKYGLLQHSGIVVGVSSGNITVIESKWGHSGLYIHPPACVPSIYGSITIVKRFTECEGKSLGGEEPKKDYEYSLGESSYNG